MGLNVFVINMKTHKIIFSLIVITIMVMNFKLYYIDKLPFTAIQAYMQNTVMTFLLIYLHKNSKGD